MTPHDMLVRLAIYYKFNFKKMFDELQKKDDKAAFLKDRLTTAKIRNMKCRKIKFLTIMDPEYPDEFKKSCIAPPLVICYTGDISLLAKAIKDKEYSYLLGPNKFELDESKLITSKFNIITFGNNELNLWTDESVDILKIIPIISKNLICTKKLRKSDTFGYIIGAALCNNINIDNIFITPTLIHSENNEFIREGFTLLDSKDQLK